MGEKANKYEVLFEESECSIAPGGYGFRWEGINLKANM
jgi:hypothetical protein